MSHPNRSSVIHVVALALVNCLCLNFIFRVKRISEMIHRVLFGFFLSLISTNNHLKNTRHLKQDHHSDLKYYLQFLTALRLRLDGIQSLGFLLPSVYKK